MPRKSSPTFSSSRACSMFVSIYVYPNVASTINVGLIAYVPHMVVLYAPLTPDPALPSARTGDGCIGLVCHVTGDESIKP